MECEFWETIRNVLFSAWKYLSFALCMWLLPPEQWIQCYRAARGCPKLSCFHFTGHRGIYAHMDMCVLHMHIWICVCYMCLCVPGNLVTGYRNPSHLPGPTVSTPVSRARHSQGNNGKRNLCMFAVKFQFGLQWNKFYPTAMWEWGTNPC